jgi:hypothetical protein
LVALTYNGVFHITEDPSGGEHVTGTQTGTFVFAPDDSEAETFREVHGLVSRQRLRSTYADALDLLEEYDLEMERIAPLMSQPQDTLFPTGRKQDPATS